MALESAQPDRVISLRDLLLVAVVYLGCFFFVFGFPHILAGFPLDDSWIHQVVGRNLANYGALGFIPGTHSSGSSSLLWSFVLAAKWKFWPSLNPVFYSAALSCIFFLAMGIGLLAMARRDGLSPTACWIWALTPALDGNFVWLGIIGMEHLLFATLSVLAAYLWFQDSRRSAWGCALCLGALSLTRPEGVVLSALIILTMRWARRTRRDAIVVLFTVCACVLFFLTANFITSHSWLPTTYAGRKWLYFGSEHISLAARVTFPYALLRTVLQPWAIHQTHILYIFNLIVVLLMLFGIIRLVQENRRRALFITAWNIVHALLYAAILPTRSHGGRYQPLFLAFIFPLLFLGLDALLRLWPAINAWLRPAALVAICLLCGIFSLARWRAVTAAGISLIEGTHARMGQYLKQNLPAGTPVASFDIGRIGFIYGSGLVDMGGLTDSSFLPYMRQHRIFDYLQERQIHYLVWPSNEDGSPGIAQVIRFTPQNLRQMTEVVRFCMPQDVWRRSYDATSDAALCQILYRLDFTK